MLVELPPVDIAAEQRFLGCLLAGYNVLACAPDMEARHFADPIHATIFAEAVKLINSRKHADNLVLKAMFEVTDTLDEVGGTDYLSLLVKAIQTCSVQEVREAGASVRCTWLQRQLIDIREYSMIACGQTDPSLLAKGAAAGILGSYIAQKDQPSPRLEEYEREEMLADTLVPMRRSLNDAGSSDLLGLIYWTGVIAPRPVFSAFGFESTPWSLIAPAATGVHCANCDHELLASSRRDRTNMHRFIRSRDGGSLYCHVCTNTKGKVFKVKAEKNKAKALGYIGRYNERRLLELREMPYAEYLRSPEWQAVRLAALQRALHRCQLCGRSGKKLHVHHNTYDRRGHELDSDVVALCWNCHSKHHNRI